MKKQLPYVLPFLPLLSLTADENTINVPEGKIVDHPSMYHDITPSAGPRVIDGCGLFLTGDYIYWTAREDNLSYATSGITFSSSSSAHRGKIHQINNEFASGFKAGFGFSFGHDKWDMAFTYTWFRSHHNKGSTTNGSSIDQLFPTITTTIPFGELNPLLKASANWKLHFNVVDMTMGRNFYVSKFLSTRPFFGFKGTWQTQKYHAEYDYNNSDATIYKTKFKNDFWGIGMMAGVNTAWHLASNWSIYGDAAFSGLWGAFNESRKDRATPFGDPTETAINLSGQFHTIKPVLELAIGLRKEGWFCDDRFHLSAQVGWEEQVWFNQNQFDFGLDNSTSGDLVLQGLSAHIRFDF